MKKAAGTLTHNDQKCFGVVQAESKGRMAELLNIVDKRFTKAYLTTYWSNDWTKYAEYSIGDIEEEGVWVTNGVGEKNAKTYRRIL